MYLGILCMFVIEITDNGEQQARHSWAQRSDRFNKLKRRKKARGISRPFICEKWAEL